MSTTTDRVRRLLALLPYLRSHPGVSIEAAAAAFDVTTEMLEKDLWLLFTDCGLPGYLPGDLIDIDFGPDGIWVREDAGLLRPLRLTAEEGLALVVALRTLRDTAEGAQREVIDRALAKVESAAEPQTTDDVTVAPPAQSAYSEVVRKALREGRALRIRYYTAGRDIVSDRTVDPMSVMLADGNWYLVAFCRTAEEVRRFRMDRIEDAQGLAEPAAASSDVPLPREPFSAHPDDHRVVLRLGPAAGWVADYYPCEDLVDLGEGNQEVTLRMADLSLARRLVLGLGSTARVVAPPKLQQDVAAAARAAMSAYETGV